MGLALLVFDRLDPTHDTGVFLLQQLLLVGAAAEERRGVVADIDGEGLEGGHDILVAASLEVLEVVEGGESLWEVDNLQVCGKHTAHKGDHEADR